MDIVHRTSHVAQQRKDRYIENKDIVQIRNVDQNYSHWL